MENEVVKEQNLLDKNGHISTPGWARSEVWKYNRDCIKAPWFRIKEWDYYLFNTDEFAVAFTISDMGYISLLSASFIDLVNKKEHTESDLEVFPHGHKYGLGASVSEADASCHTKRLNMAFSKTDAGRHISVNFNDFDKANHSDLKAELDVKEADMESVYIATPWAKKPTAFYYNCKKNCLTAEGFVSYCGKTYELKHESCAGVLDWGRGVWTYDNTWYWGTGSGHIKGELFGFNIGYGFSDRSSASENGLYYKGKIHKIEGVNIDIPKGTDGRDIYMQEWHITSAGDRFSGTFTPILDRSAFMDFKLIISDQHQVFGRFNGKAVMDDGEVIELKDFTCAIEKVRNKY